MFTSARKICDFVHDQARPAGFSFTSRKFTQRNLVLPRLFSRFTRAASNHGFGNDGPHLVNRRSRPSLRRVGGHFTSMGLLSLEKLTELQAAPLPVTDAGCGRSRHCFWKHGLRTDILVLLQGTSHSWIHGMSPSSDAAKNLPVAGFSAWKQKSHRREYELRRRDLVYAWRGCVQGLTMMYPTKNHSWQRCTV